MATRKSTRRAFLQSASVLPASFLYVHASTLGRGHAVAANDRIAVGCIGVGSRGGAVMQGFLKNKLCQVVGVCDVKRNVLEQKQELVNSHYDSQDCKSHHDFRELAAREDIDACLVAPCDHWHVLAALAAVRSGKDVYVEKPLGLSFEQDQALRREVKRNNRIFQFGTQQRSSHEFQLACHIARSSLIGDIHTINVWSPGSSSGGDATVVPVPEWLDYDFWLGPAPKVPYTKDRCSNEWWWFISDYALGFIAGWGIHPIDIAYWGAKDKFTGPWTVKGTGQFPTEGVCDTATNWQIEIALGSGTKINFHGNPYPDEWKERYGDTEAHGTAFEGSEGWVFVRRGVINASQKSLLDTKVELPADTNQFSDMTDNHVDNFLQSVRSRKQPHSGIEDSVKSDSLCHISDIAIRLKREVTFDPVEEVFVNDAEANAMLKRGMREPWKLKS